MTGKSWMSASLCIALAGGVAPVGVFAGNLVTVPVRATNDGASFVADGVVEAVRQTGIAAQISGAIVDLPVKAGDTVKAGQLLVRMDARAANQEAKASQAQVDAARASLIVAQKDYERQKQLFAKNYISQAQLDRAESQFQTASAQASAQIAQAGAVKTQSGFYVLAAPYAGVVSEVPVMLGDMAMPGRTLMTVYDPVAMRVTATVPQERVAEIAAEQKIMVEIPGMPASQRLIPASKLTVLPMVDAATHTAQIRLELPQKISGLAPGMFARVSLRSKSVSGEVNRLYVPLKSVFRRAELNAVYVVNSQGKPILRQVKLGPVSGNEQEVLSGVSAGEQVAADPLVATRTAVSR
ncbi:efflux RND transporter periplasmic adaptor subunit [Undibacterium sp. WLHG33]|uniref:efflux RND transporter periplasmic adaptor subunit n=1 Tax=Undibacterium sp. WLHG33 TaxID=3412482 RepID=UPI003C2F1996